MRQLAWLPIIVSLHCGLIFADERSSAAPEPRLLTVSSQTSAPTNGLKIDWSELSKGFLASRVVLPPRPRVTHSILPLRRITLVGGDRFVAECLDWQTDAVTFRLLSGQTIQVPVAAVARLGNPPGEVEFMEDLYEAIPQDQLDTAIRKMHDETRLADGRRSLRLGSNCHSYRRSFAPSLTSARIEFSFRISASDLSSGCGEWSLERDQETARKPPITVRIGPDRQIGLVGDLSGMSVSSQTLKLSEASDQWHSFIALVSPESLRLIVDGASLASVPWQRSSIPAIQFRSAGTEPENKLWIDAFRVQSLGPPQACEQSHQDPTDSDVACLATGDELFGRLIEVNRTTVTMEVSRQSQAFAWSRLLGVGWHQPSTPVQQTLRPKSGVVSKIEMQPFVDRPECEPEKWTVTIVSVDSQMVIAQHSLAGELSLKWSEIRRIDPHFFGRTLLVDGRRFHLGNSIRSDFHRQLPDGTEIRGDFQLQEIGSGQPYLSLEVTELEAASPVAPPASPFLAELRAGKLVTELFVNDQRIGDINSLIRFKAPVQNPDHVRMEIPRGLLKRGSNSFRLHQIPLKPDGREFDDCEIGDIRLEFDDR